VRRSRPRARLTPPAGCRSERQIVEMAERVPRSFRELLDIAEVSNVKVQKFGEATLTAIMEVLARPGFVNFARFGEFEYKPASSNEYVASRGGCEEEDEELGSPPTAAAAAPAAAAAAASKKLKLVG
jgi:hypothetical protein